MAVTSNNTYLSMEEMIGNAQYILDKFLALGWTKNAICGMLGNMQTESTINPGLWESLQQGNMQNGFGLVQWTPVTVLTDWMDANGYQNDWGNIDGQIARIQYEHDHNEQWIAKPAYPISFDEFIHSTDTAGNLAMVFINNYERPLDANQPNRATQAEYWFANLTGGGTVEPPPTTTKHKMPLYMYKLF